MLSAAIPVRSALLRDAAAMAAIYNQGIEDRVATFQTRAHGGAGFEVRMRAGQTLIVAEVGDRVVGWAGIAPYADTAAYYAGVGECMVYVERSARGRGVGRALVEALADGAERHGLYKLVGKLFTTNTASIELFHRSGFRDVGVHHRHGKLDGDWHDVLVVERLLGDAAGG